MLMRVLLLLLCVVLVACGRANSGYVERGASVTLAITLVAPDAVPTTTLTDPILVEGQRNYDLYCAHCHGYDGSGQIAATIEGTLNLGMKLVPAHDSTGHTFLHPDQLLLRTVREGVPNPLMQFPMPPFEGVLTDEQIMGTLEYISLWWTEEQREGQDAVTERWTQIMAGQPAASNTD